VNSRRLKWSHVSLALGLVLCSPLAISAQVDQPGKPEVLVARLRDLYSQHRSSNRSDTWAPVMKGMQVLTASGEPAIEPISLALQHEPDQVLQGLFARSLAEMPGESGTRVLLALYNTRAALRQAIENALVSRGQKYEAIGFALSEQEIGPFFETLKEVPAMNVPLTASVLATCHANDLAPAVRILLDRFLNQIKNPIPSLPRKTALPSSHFSPQVEAMRNLLKAFAALRKEGVPVLREARQNTDNGEEDKWLQIALGYAGDKEIAPGLAETVKNEDDRYIRAVAIESYARSAGRDALALLKQFEDDTTVSEYGDKSLPDVRILREAATSSIAAIQAGEFAQ
jgi:hypothetical protein